MEGWRGGQFATLSRVIREGLIEQVMAKRSLEGDERALCISWEEHSKQRGWQLPSPLGIVMLKNTKEVGVK